MSPTFLVLAIGDELMEGRHVDRNSAAISRHLVQLGFEPREHVTLPDDEVAIGRKDDPILRPGEGLMRRGPEQRAGRGV